MTLARAHNRDTVPLNIGTIYSVTTETGDLFRGQDIMFLHKSPHFIGNYIIRKDQ